MGVLDTGATISIVAKKTLPCGSLNNTMTTAAIRMGDGHVVQSCRDCEVEVPMGSRTMAHRFYVMDIEAFDFVLGTDFFVQHFQILPDTSLRGPRQWQRVRERVSDVPCLLLILKTLIAFQKMFPQNCKKVKSTNKEHVRQDQSQNCDSILPNQSVVSKEGLHIDK